MTITINGTNGLIQAYDYQVLTTGFTYTFAAGTQVLVINPAGTLATGTVTMPSAPSDGMTITVESTQQVTALTMSGNGNTLVGSAVQLIPNQPLSWVYRAANTTWYPFRGGAGRATSLVSGTAATTTSGTTVDFTSIPSWVKRVTVMFSGVSTSGTSNLQFQIGSGSVSTSGYLGSFAYVGTAAASGTTPTTGFAIATLVTAASVFHGTAVISLLGSNIWTYSQSISRSDANQSYFSSGSNTLSGALDRVRITTVGGTDTFDAGSINILYE